MGIEQDLAEMIQSAENEAITAYCKEWIKETGCPISEAEMVVRTHYDEDKGQYAVHYSLQRKQR